MMTVETLLVITGYDEVSFGDVKRRYPITNDEWELDETGTEYVSVGNNGNVPRLDPWGRKFRPWKCDVAASPRHWIDHSYDDYKYTRWTTIEGVPIKLVTI